jgi:hypothetical protein
MEAEGEETSPSDAGDEAGASVSPVAGGRTGNCHAMAWGDHTVVATIHPSAVLRAADPTIVTVCVPP